MPTKQNEFKAYLTFVGDFDPEEVTSIIGVAPTEFWHKGDINPVSHHERKFSRWSLYSSLDPAQPIVEHIRDVLKQLAPYVDRVNAVPTTIERGMQTVAYFHSDTPWFHFDEDVVAGCAAMNLSIDCDFYTLYSDRREDSE
jgi:hypothetical protein